MTLFQGFDTPLSYGKIPKWKKDIKAVRFIEPKGKEQQLCSLPVYLLQTSVEDSEIFYDTRNGAIRSFCTSERGFWSMLDSASWSTTIRVGKGILLNRLKETLRNLVQNGIIKQFETFQIYTKHDFTKDSIEDWIPQHRVGRRTEKSIGNERMIRVSRKYFASPVPKSHSPKTSVKEADIGCPRLQSTIQRELSETEEPSRSADANFHSFRVVSDKDFAQALLNRLGNLTVTLESILDSKNWSNTVYVTFERRKMRLLVSI